MYTERAQSDARSLRKRNAAAAVCLSGGASMCFGVGLPIRKRTQAGGQTTRTKKQNRPNSDVDAGGRTRFNEHQSWRLGPNSTRPQMGYGTQQLDRQAGLWSRDDQQASVAAFCVREALSNWKPNGPFSRIRRRNFVHFRRFVPSVSCSQVKR